MTDTSKSQPKKNSAFRKIRCEHNGCKRKIKTIYLIKCKCGGSYCTSHKSSDDHDCNFDHKGEYIKKLEKENPVIQFSKINKINENKSSENKITDNNKDKNGDNNKDKNGDNNKDKNKNINDMDFTDFLDKFF